MRWERGCQLQSSACLLVPILGISQLPVRSPTAWTFREYSHSSYNYIAQLHWICPSIRDVDFHHLVSHGSCAKRVQRPTPLLGAAASFRGSLTDVPNHFQYQVRSPHLRRFELSEHVLGSLVGSADLLTDEIRIQSRSCQSPCGTECGMRLE